MRREARRLWVAMAPRGACGHRAGDDGAVCDGQIRRGRPVSYSARDDGAWSVCRERRKASGKSGPRYGVAGPGELADEGMELARLASAVASGVVWEAPDESNELDCSQSSCGGGIREVVASNCSRASHPRAMVVRMTPVQLAGLLTRCMTARNRFGGGGAVGSATSTSSSMLSSTDIS